MAEALLPAVLSADQHRRTVFETIESAGSHGNARIYALHRSRLIVAGEGCDGLHGNRVIGLHDVNKSSRAVVLHGGGRYQCGAVQRAYQQAGIHKLVGKQREIRVGKLGAELDRPGSRVHLVVQRCQFSGFDLLVVGAVESVHRELVSAVQLRLDLRQIVL